MKKALSPINIDKEIYSRMTYVLKVNPELGYKSRTQFVEKTLEEKLDKIETELVLKMIKDEGLMKFKEKTRKLLERSSRLEKQHAELIKKIDLNIQMVAEIKKEKHTPRVYKSKKK